MAASSVPPISSAPRGIPDAGKPNENIRNVNSETESTTSWSDFSTDSDTPRTEEQLERIKQQEKFLEKIVNASPLESYFIGKALDKRIEPILSASTKSAPIPTRTTLIHPTVSALKGDDLVSRTPSPTPFTDDEDETEVVGSNATTPAPSATTKEDEEDVAKLAAMIFELMNPPQDDFSLFSRSF